MEQPFEKLEYNNAWGQYADIEEEISLHITKAIVKKKPESIKKIEQIEQIKKEKVIQQYHVSNKLTKFQYCIIAIFIYLTCHVILII
jgi:hypothetical protein